MKTFTNTLAGIALTAAVSSIVPMAVTTQANAATDVKPMLSVSGKSYYQKQKAKSSAVGRWEKTAIIQHGSGYGKWGKAKKTSFDCNSKFHQGNGNKVWTCKARGRPVANVQICVSGKVNAKWFHPNEAGAKAGVRKGWEKLAAGKYGIKYSFYKNAKNKHSTCGVDSKHPGKITCTLSATPCS
jgi:hypothetical protein